MTRLLSWQSIVAICLFLGTGCDGEGAQNTASTHAFGGAGGADATEGGGGADDTKGSGGDATEGGGGTGASASNDPAESCPLLGDADEVLTLPGDVVLRADGHPVRVAKNSDTFASLELDPLGASSVTVYYDGGNTVTAVFSSEDQEEYIGCEQRNEWPECKALSVREINTGPEATYTLEVRGEAPGFWIVAMPTEDAPFACER